jgi:hypothetical protein
VQGSKRSVCDNHGTCFSALIASPSGRENTAENNLLTSVRFQSAGFATISIAVARCRTFQGCTKKSNSRKSPIRTESTCTEMRLR